MDQNDLGKRPFETFILDALLSYTNGIKYIAYDGKWLCKVPFVGHCHSVSLIRRNVVAVVRLRKKDHLPQKLPDNVFSPTWPQSSMLPCYECVILI